MRIPHERRGSVRRMSHATWMPVTAAIVLGGAATAIPWRLVRVRRRQSPAALAGALFLVSVAAVFLVDALTIEHPSPSLALALRILAAGAGCFAVLALRRTDVAVHAAVHTAVHANGDGAANRDGDANA